MIGKVLAIYIEQQIERRQARAWLRANHPVRIACDAMFRLNRHAGSADEMMSDAIYAYKNDLVKWLVAHGYCTEVNEHTQNRRCWGCEGTGIYQSWFSGYQDTCYKCGGTGVYATYKLHCFRFEVDGKRYSWHQPERLVQFEIDPALIKDDPKEIGEMKNGHRLEPGQVSILLTTVREFMASVGCQVGWMRLRDIPGREWYAVTSCIANLPQWAKWTIREVTNKLHNRFGVQEANYYGDDEIPF